MSFEEAIQKHRDENKEFCQKAANITNCYVTQDRDGTIIIWHKDVKREYLVCNPRGIWCLLERIDISGSHAIINYDKQPHIYKFEPILFFPDLNKE